MPLWDGNDLDLNALDIGLYLTSTGIGFGAAPNSLQGTEVSYGALTSSTYSYVANDNNKYITLTFVQHKNGIIIHDNSGTALVSNGYKSANNTALESIIVNTEFIAGVELNNAWPTNGDFTTINSTFDTTMKTQLLPEPATATLSLLALVGLAARRRRSSH